MIDDFEDYKIVHDNDELDELQREIVLDRIHKRNAERAWRECWILWQPDSDK